MKIIKERLLWRNSDLQKILLINLKNIISNYWKFIIKSHIIFNIELTYLSSVWCREEHLYYVSIMQKGKEIWSVVMYVWSGVLCLLGELQWIASRLDTVRAAWTRAWDGEWSTTLSALSARVKWKCKLFSAWNVSSHRLQESENAPVCPNGRFPCLSTL